MSRTKTLARTRAQARKKRHPKTPPETGPFLAGNKLNAVLCVLLAAVTIALYSPVIGNSFVVWDDEVYVTKNPHIHGGLGWNTVRWAFTSTEAANWHPLTWLSHALDYQLFALNPAGHHFDSVLIHALNTVLLFLLLAWVTKRVWPSLLVAALFAVHPLNVESVAWVAERKNVLSTLFFLLAIGAYVWYAKRPHWRRYLLVAALFAAGLMAKPMVITLPFVLLLLDYWPLDRALLDENQGNAGPDVRVPRVAFSILVLEKVPLFFFSALSAVITVKAQTHMVRSLYQFPIAVRIENAVVAYLLYLWKMLWPGRLAFLYPHPGYTLPSWQLILSALVLTSVTALVVAFRARGYLPVGWFWFLGTLVPVIGVVQVGWAAMADRYAYVPLIGIFVMIAWGLDDWAEAGRIRTGWRVIPALCVLTALGFVTLHQESHWKNEYTLWAHTLAVTEQNPYAHDALGAALMSPGLAVTASNLDGLDTEQKRIDEARRHWTQALEMRRQLLPDHPESRIQDMATELSSLGSLDRLQNRTDEARQHYEEALKIRRQLAEQNPAVYRVDVAATLSDLGALDLTQNRTDQARQHYQEALQSYRQSMQQYPDAYLPDMAATLSNLGALDLTQNRTDEARQHYQEALQSYRQLARQNPDAQLPDMAVALNNLGNLDRQQNRMDEARQHFEAALKIYYQLAHQNPPIYLPDLAVILNNLGKLDGVQNRMDDARQHFEGAMKIYYQLAQHSPDKYLPDLAWTLKSMGFVERLQKRVEESRAHYAEALTLYRKLAQGDPEKYAGDVARVEASLRELDKKVNSR